MEAAEIAGVSQQIGGRRALTVPIMLYKAVALSAVSRVNLDQPSMRGLCAFKGSHG